MPASSNTRRWALLGAVLLACATSTVVSVPSAIAAVPTCQGKAATIVGTAKDDTLNGTPGDDVIVGGAGLDVIYG